MIYATTLPVIIKPDQMEVTDASASLHNADCPIVLPDIGPIESPNWPLYKPNPAMSDKNQSTGRVLHTNSWLMHQVWARDRLRKYPHNRTGWLVFVIVGLVLVPCSKRVGARWGLSDFVSLILMPQSIIQKRLPIDGSIFSTLFLPQIVQNVCITLRPIWVCLLCVSGIALPRIVPVLHHSVVHFLSLIHI